MDVLFRIWAILALVGLNAFFVAAEFALVGARTTRLQTLAEAGDGKARGALKAIHHLDDYISATQLGITLASLSLGWIGEATLATLLMHAFHTLPPPFASLASHAVAGTAAFACITFLLIVLGELVAQIPGAATPRANQPLDRAPVDVVHAYAFWPADLAPEPERQRLPATFLGASAKPGGARARARRTAVAAFGKPSPRLWWRSRTPA